MELEKRVNEIESELKIVKGEIKELLVDIRDLVNKNENPFCTIPYPEALKKSAQDKEENTENQSSMKGNIEAECKSCAEVSDLENKIVKNNEESMKQEEPVHETPAQNTQKQEIYSSEQEKILKLDIFLLVELMRWADYAVRTVGHKNLKELLNLYNITGQLPEETKRIIENIANLSTEEPAEEEKVSMKDNITVLSQLSIILNPEGFRKNIQPDLSCWKDKEKERKAGIVSIEFETQKDLRS